MTDRSKAILDYLANHNTMVLSTNGSEGLWSTPVFYVNRENRLYFLSDLNSKHSRNLRENPVIAVTVTEDYKDWQQIQGLQIRGQATTVSSLKETAVVMALYLKKFPAAKHILQNPGSFKGVANARWHRIEPQYIKVTDNTKKFGEHFEIEYLEE